MLKRNLVPAALLALIGATLPLSAFAAQAILNVPYDPTRELNQDVNYSPPNLSG